MALRKRYVRKVRKVPRKRTVVRKALRSAWKKDVSSVVKQVLSRRIEVKSYSTATRFVLSQTQACSSDSTFFRNNNILQLTPNATNMLIDQGVGDSQRIGSTIRTKRVIFKGLMCPSAIDSIFNPTLSRPMEVRMVLCSIKGGNIGQTPTSLLQICQSSIFNENNSSYSLTTSGSTANIWDMMRRLNNDLLTIHKVKVFKVGGQVTQTGTAGGGAANPDVDGFQFNAKFSMDVTKYVPKIVNFNDTNSDSTGKQLFALFIVCDATGLPPASNPNRPLLLYTNVEYQYTDA